MLRLGFVEDELEGADVDRAEDSHHQLREAQSSHTNQDWIEHIPRLPTWAKFNSWRVSTVFVVLFKWSVCRFLSEYFPALFSGLETT